MAKSYPIAGIISSWFKACDKLGNGNISIQLLVSYMKRSNHGFLAQRTTHSAIPLTSLPKNTPRKHHARLNFKHLRIYVGLNNRCNCFGIIRNYCILSLLLCLVPKLYFSVLFNWHFDFFIQMSRTSCLPLSFHQTSKTMFTTTSRHVKRLDVSTRASQNFWSYLPHSLLSSEWAGATLVAVSEG